MSTPRIYSTCLRCERLDRELKAARKVIDEARDGPVYWKALAKLVREYDRVRTDGRKNEEGRL